MKTFVGNNKDSKFILLYYMTMDEESRQRLYSQKASEISFDEMTGILTDELPQMTLESVRIPLHDDMTRAENREYVRKRVQQIYDSPEFLYFLGMD